MTNATTGEQVTGTTVVPCLVHGGAAFALVCGDRPLDHMRYKTVRRGNIATLLNRWGAQFFAFG